MNELPPEFLSSITGWRGAQAVSQSVTDVPFMALTHLEKGQATRTTGVTDEGTPGLARGF